MTLPMIPLLFLFAPSSGNGAEDPAPGVPLSALAQSFDVLGSMRVGGLLRAYLDIADDELSAVPNEDVQAFRIYDAQLWFSAEVAGYEAFIKLDAGEATAFPLIPDDGVQTIELRDAWIRKALADQVYLYVGQYKCPLVASGNVGDGGLAMIDRTRIGYLFSFPGAYQPGVAITGDFGAFHGKIAVQNGADSKTDGLGIVARGEFKVGQGAKQHEGALGAQGFNGTFGVGYFKDDSDIAGSDFGSAVALDAYTTLDQFSLHAEILDADEELASRALGNVTEDATPFSATLGYLINDQFEVFGRFQDLDNEADASIVGVGLNYYVQGHAVKWQVNASQYDDDLIDGTILQAGLSIGHSGDCCGQTTLADSRP